MKPSDSIQKRLFFLVIAIYLIVIFFSFGTNRNWSYKIESDGKYHYQYVISLYLDKDIDFTNNYRYPTPNYAQVPIDNYDLQSWILPTGLPNNMWGIGCAVLWYPFFSVIQLFAPGSGWEMEYHYGVMISAVIYTVLGLWLLYNVLSHYFTQCATRITVLGLLMSTSLLYYSTIEVSMSHAYDFFTLSALIYYFVKILHQPEQKRFYGFMGLLGGLHVLVRTQNALTVFFISVSLVIYILWKQRQYWYYLSFYIAGGALMATVLLLTNQTLYGDIFSIPQGRNFLDLSNPALYGFLFSGRNGVFSHHPILFVAFIGLGIALFRWRDAPIERAFLLIPLVLALLLQIYLNASVRDWWSGNSFGQRRLVGMLVVFAFGFAQIARYRFMSWIVILFSGVNLYLMMVHIFSWQYDEVHNIPRWLFDAPGWLLDSLRTRPIGFFGIISGIAVVFMLTPESPDDHQQTTS